MAAGDHGTAAGSTLISGVAPNAYLGNYKALTIPTPGFGLDGNSAELAAAVEAAVADGMDVINMSLGEPEVEPSRDLLVTALEGAAAAGVVPVIAAGNDFSDFGFGSVSSPGSAPSAIGPVEWSDAGGGAGDWAVTTVVKQGSGTLAAPPTVTAPAALSVTATAGPSPSDVTGFVVLTRGTDVRRIPFWFAVSAPKLGSEAKTTLTRAGTYKGTTAGAPSLISAYRYPTGGDVQYPGPERAYRVTVAGLPANFR